MTKYYTLILIFQFLDITTGVIQAFYINNFSSKNLKEGVFRKIFIWLAIVTSFFIEKWLGITFLSYVCNIFIGYEVMSIIENLGKLDVNMNIFPENVKQILQSFKVVNKEIARENDRNINLQNEIDNKIKIENRNRK